MVDIGCVIIDQLVDNLHSFRIHFLSWQVVTNCFHQINSNVLNSFLVIFQIFCFNRLAYYLGHVFKHLFDHLVLPYFLLVFYQSEYEVDDLFFEIETHVSVQQHFGRLNDVQHTAQMFVENSGNLDNIGHCFQTQCAHFFIVVIQTLSKHVNHRFDQFFFQHFLLLFVELFQIVQQMHDVFQCLLSNLLVHI